MLGRMTDPPYQLSACRVGEDGAAKSLIADRDVMRFHMLAVVCWHVVVTSLELVGVEGDEPTLPSFHLEFYHDAAMLQHHLKACRGIMGVQLHRRS
jgi:hypothetical protein